MKRIIILLLAGLTFPLAGPTNGHAKGTTGQISIGVSTHFGRAGVFYTSLARYGEWIELEPGYYAWRPLSVRAGWRPYSHGRWVWSDYGWYWVSYEPFGWATFHYGRWYDDDYYGWIWIPDNVWGPAWVEWRYNDDYIGWAPLPPYASFNISVGIRFTTRWHAPAHYWTFVGCRNFSSPNVMRYATPVEYSRRLIGYTRSTTRYEVDGSRIVNRGVDRGFVERRGNVRIGRTEIDEVREPGERVIRSGGNERVQVYRPSRGDWERAPERIDARRGDRSTSLDLERVERNRSTQFERGDGQNSGRQRDDERIRAPERDQRREYQLPFRRERNEDESARERRITIPRSREVEPPAERRETSRERFPQPERKTVEPQREKMDSPRQTPERKRDNDGGRESRRGERREGRSGRDQ